MNGDATIEVLQAIAIMLAIPYVVGFPLAAVWVLTALAVRAVTGWRGLLPANVWQDGRGQ